MILQVAAKISTSLKSDGLLVGGLSSLNSLLSAVNASKYADKSDKKVLHIKEEQAV